MIDKTFSQSKHRHQLAQIPGQVRHQLTLDSFTWLWKLLIPEQVTHVDAQHRKFMFSLSELLFHLQKHVCPSGQPRQYFSPTLNSYKSVCGGKTRAPGTCGDTSAKEQEFVAQWLCPAGMWCIVFPQCWAPEAKCSCQGELATADWDYIFSNFDLTTLGLKLFETEYQVCLSSDQRWPEYLKLIAPFHPSTISVDPAKRIISPSKTMLRLIFDEKEILSWTYFP